MSGAAASSGADDLDADHPVPHPAHRPVPAATQDVPGRRSARRKARKRALDILFEADLRGTEAMATARDRLAQSDPPVPEYAIRLIEGVTARRARLDELISTYSEGWTLDRMPGVDRNLLRIATFELLFADDIPDVVAIDEAVDLARELSTDESPRFVNGLLGRLQLLKAELAG